MAFTVSLSSHSQPNFQNSFSSIPGHFMKWSTTQKEEENQSDGVKSSEKKESTAPDHSKPRNRIVIKLRKKNDNKTDDHDHTQLQNQTLVVSDAGDSSNQNIKPWKLRSSSPSRKDQDHASASASAHARVQDQAQAKPSDDHESSQLGLGFVAKKLEKRKIQSFSIALSKEEIEADILAITGSKPTRRPKKRPRNVQRQLDNLFPGLCLNLKSVAPNS
ncbi:hypothetical protein Ddye_018251 [Dipteronia dyeriana]|uniref:Uncharacterized protein n=1 Tax=Dipteronia dyeriana TaxID=168575 RepID=A0AAD9X1T5_9ROSI|nr:hypothetical protein Ddye_018251 [Dipteronia dyeriana]